MPALRRPEEVEIHWEERGDGPLVVLLHHCFSHPAVYEALCEELARDHRVVTYDPRGTGRSSRKGPYDLLMDVEDLEALAGELGGDAVAVGLGDGRDRAVRVARARPDLIRAVVGCDATPMGRSVEDVEAPSASQPVLEAVVRLADSNYRTAIRSILEFTNPGMSEDELRRRLDAEVAYTSREAMLARSQWFLRRDSVETARAIRDRLWIAYWESDWTPRDVAGKIHDLLPEARLYPVGAGPISRPDLTADVVRKVTRPAGRVEDARAVELDRAGTGQRGMHANGAAHLLTGAGYGLADFHDGRHGDTEDVVPVGDVGDPASAECVLGLVERLTHDIRHCRRRRLARLRVGGALPPHHQRWQEERSEQPDGDSGAHEQTTLHRAGHGAASYLRRAAPAPGPVQRDVWLASKLRP